MNIQVRFLRMRLLLARLAPDPYHETCEVLDRYLSPAEDPPNYFRHPHVQNAEQGVELKWQGKEAKP